MQYILNTTRRLGHPESDHFFKTGISVLNNLKTWKKFQNKKKNTEKEQFLQNVLLGAMFQELRAYFCFRVLYFSFRVAAHDEMKWWNLTKYFHTFRPEFPDFCCWLRRIRNKLRLTVTTYELSWFCIFPLSFSSFPSTCYLITLRYNSCHTYISPIIFDVSIFSSLPS